MKDIKQRSLDLHELHKGKISVNSKVKVENADDLSLAYSPGVAEPCREIQKDRENIYKYTSKGNMVAVISDGTAVLGLGDIGPYAGLPVMEGKCILFKEFAGVDAFPIMLDTKDPEEIINIVKKISVGFGGINLEDIAAPDCFIIEQKLKEILDIPVFHDDQHGTAIITTAALINALDISGKSIKEIKVVVNGAGASAQACTELFKNFGVPNENVIMLDRKGVIYKDRTDGIDQWKSRHACISRPSLSSLSITSILDIQWGDTTF